jgi:transcriptional regulator with XRE-family HTH domain
VADLKRSIGIDVERFRVDAGLTRSRLADAAGIDPGYLLRIERGDHEPSLSTLAALSKALGADLSVRLFPNTGPRIRDRHQAAIAEALIAIIDARRWATTAEVGVRKPVSGSVDLVVHDRGARLIVATEIESLLRRLEQLLRWHREKAAALPSSDLWRFAAAEDVPTISRLLVIRSTDADRQVARQYPGHLASAYPGRTAEARAALTGTGLWPGASILWADVRNGVATILEGPPRGVALGR